MSVANKTGRGTPLFIVSTGERWFYINRNWIKFPTYLADTSLRTSPVVAHTRNRDEAVRLSKGEAAEEALQVRGKVCKL